MRSSRSRLCVAGLFASLLAALPASAQQSVVPGAAAVAPKPAYVPDGQSIKYDKEIQAFLDVDLATPPPKNGILFIGSSIFRQWENLAEQMAPLPVEAFFDRAHEALPGAQLFYVDIQKAPDKRARWAVVDSANAAVRRYVAARAGYMRAIDLNPVLIDAAGNPRGELYRPHSLHFLAPAYVEFSKVIKPVLQQAWAKRASGASR